jgi:hypothetical protein
MHGAAGQGSGARRARDDLESTHFEYSDSDDEC